MLTCTVGGRTDVLAIEFKNPDGTNELSDEQKPYPNKFESVTDKTQVIDIMTRY